MQTPEQIVQYSLECYNNREINSFLSVFSETVTFRNYLSAAPSMQGLKEVRAFYQMLFTSSPLLHSTILSRIIMGNKVIDHERISGRMNAGPVVEMILVYEVQSGKIENVTVIRNE